MERKELLRQHHLAEAGLAITMDELDKVRKEHKAALEALEAQFSNRLDILYTAKRKQEQELHELDEALAPVPQLTVGVVHLDMPVTILVDGTDSDRKAWLRGPGHDKAQQIANTIAQLFGEEHAKISWSQTAGCGCSPGWVVSIDRPVWAETWKLLTQVGVRDSGERRVSAWGLGLDERHVPKRIWKFIDNYVKKADAAA